MKRRRTKMSQNRLVSFFKHIFPSSRSEMESLIEPFLLAVVSGAVMRLPFPELEWDWVAWVGLAPFLRVLRKRSAKHGAWIGFVFGAVFFYLNLTWLNTLSEYNPLAPVGVFFLALICALSTALFGAGAAIVLGRRGWFRLLFIPALWCAIESARALTELAFPWIYLGHSQVARLTLIQICDLTGVGGLSFLIVLVNLVLADTSCLILRELETNAVKRFWPKWVLVICLIGFVYFYGVWRLAESKATQSAADDSGPFRVALIQPGIKQSLKFRSYTDENAAAREQIQTDMRQIMADQIGSVRAGCEKASTPLPDLYVLPESALTHPGFNLIPEQTAFMQELARAAGAPIFFGANRFYVPPGATKDSQCSGYNSAYLADGVTGVDIAGAYDKMRLVPFGEFSSYLDIIPGFTKMILGIGEFTEGKQPRLFQVGTKQFGCVICFESSFPNLFRKYDALDPDWMTVITNDAWYKTSSGPRRHQTLSIFRAIETRRPIVRVANTGISCVIDPWGNTIGSLSLNEEQPAQLTVAVPERPASMQGRQTFYMRHGEWFPLLCALFCAGGAAWLLAGIAQRRREQKIR